MHFYTISPEIEYPSVTTILSLTLPKAAIHRWKLNTPDWRKQQRDAQIVGIILHGRILRKVNKFAPPTGDLPIDEIDECTDELLSCVELGELQFNELNLDIKQPIQTETLVINHAHRYAGKFDLCANIGGVTTLLDLKTSKNNYDSHRLQLGGYAAAMDTFPQRGMIVYCDYREKSNPYQRARVVEFSRGELERASKEFFELAREFHTRYPDGRASIMEGIAL